MLLFCVVVVLFVFVEKERLDQLIISRWECVNKYAVATTIVDATAIDECINPIIAEINRLEELKAECSHAYNDNTDTIFCLSTIILKN